MWEPKVHKQDFGYLKFGEEDYLYEYLVKDWNMLGNDDFENMMHNEKHGPYHVVVVEAEWKVVFEDGITCGFCTVGAGDSFESCVKSLNLMYEHFEYAKTCKTSSEFREGRHGPQTD